MNKLRKSNQTLEEYVKSIYDIEKGLNFSYKNMKELEDKYELTYLAYSALYAKFKEAQKVEKAKVDRIRNSGGVANIGTKEEGAIIEMLNIDNKLIVLKERAIYEFMLADKVDPQRENPDLPTNIQRKLLSKGSESKMVSRTFITAKILLKSGFFYDNINVDKATLLMLELLQELTILEKEINEFIQKEESLNLEYESRRDENVSYSIPAFGDVETRCKTIFQKADHVEQILMEFITMFYPNEKLTKQSHFPKFYEMIKNKYGESDGFCKFIQSILYNMKIIRGIRNGLDHRLETTKVYDYELQKNSDVLTPSIEFESKRDKLKLDRVALSEILPILLESLISISEETIAYISSKNVKSMGLGNQVREVPEEKRRFEHVKYCLWSPIGDGGFYNQQLK